LDKVKFDKGENMKKITSIFILAAFAALLGINGLLLKEPEIMFMNEG